MNRAEICQLLTDKVNKLKDKQEMLSDLLPDIRLLYGTQPGTRTPVMYQPGIVFLFSGHKIGYINERTFRYDTNEYLLLTVPLPFECETFATPEVPLAGMRLNVDILQLQELLMDIGEDELFQPSVASSGINSAVLSEEILCAAERLLDVMERPLDARILGKQIIREILYHVMIGPCGGALLARPVEAISLLDVYRAVEDQPYFMLHRTRPNDACYIGHAITPVLEQEFARVGLALEASLAQTSIAEMAGQVERRAGYPFVPCSPQYQADTQ